jgi:hypothetical protein
MHLVMAVRNLASGVLIPRSVNVAKFTRLSNINEFLHLLIVLLIVYDCREGQT